MEPLWKATSIWRNLGLIESRKPTFWDKFGKAFKNDRARGGKKKGFSEFPWIHWSSELVSSLLMALAQALCEYQV
jgi:hypothetical protein